MILGFPSYMGTIPYARKTSNEASFPRNSFSYISWAYRLFYWASNKTKGEKKLLKRNSGINKRPRHEG